MSGISATRVPSANTLYAPVRLGLTYLLWLCGAVLATLAGLACSEASVDGDSRWGRPRLTQSAAVSTSRRETRQAKGNSPSGPQAVRPGTTRPILFGMHSVHEVTVASGSCLFSVQLVIEGVRRGRWGPSVSTARASSPVLCGGRNECRSCAEGRADGHGSTQTTTRTRSGQSRTSSRGWAP